MIWILGIEEVGRPETSRVENDGNPSEVRIPEWLVEFRQFIRDEPEQEVRVEVLALFVLAVCRHRVAAGHVPNGLGVQRLLVVIDFIDDGLARTSKLRQLLLRAILVVTILQDRSVGHRAVATARHTPGDMAEESKEG